MESSLKKILISNLLYYPVILLSILLTIILFQGVSVGELFGVIVVAAFWSFHIIGFITVLFLLDLFYYKFLKLDWKLVFFLQYLLLSVIVVAILMNMTDERMKDIAIILMPTSSIYFLWKYNWIKDS